MSLSFRGLALLLVTAPLLALQMWLPTAGWVAFGYGLLALGVIWLDWRAAGPVEAFEVGRAHETKLSLGADNVIRLSVRNRRPRAIRFQLRDEPPDAFGIETRVHAGRVGALDVWHGRYTVRPLRRGDYTFGDITLRWPGPIGLVVRQGRVAAAAPVKVYPNLLDVRRYDIALRRNRLQELGLRASRRFGDGTDFERLREYLPDDEYRKINWKATARRNRPVTVQYQTERSQSVIAVVDVGRMMQSPVTHMAKLDYVLNAVLLLGFVATGKGDKVGLLSFDHTVRQYLSPRAGRGQFYRMLETLYAVEAQPVEPDYAQALSYLSLKHRKRALVVIFTDLSGGVTMDALSTQVSRLARRNLTLVVTISDPDVVAAAQQVPAETLTVYQRAAAVQLLDDRRLTLEQLHRQGVLTLDVPANQLSLAVINRYLELKARTML